MTNSTMIITKITTRIIRIMTRITTKTTRIMKITITRKPTNISMIISMDFSNHGQNEDD